MLMRKKGKRFNINRENIDKFSLQQLEVIYANIVDSLADINLQLEDVKYKMSIGEKSDPDWLHKIKRAKRIKGYQHQLIAQHIKKLKKEKRLNSHDTKYDILYQLLKKTMDANDFKELIAKVEDIFANGGIENLEPEDYETIDYSENFDNLES